MSKWSKVAFFGALLIGAGHFFGTICKGVSQAYEQILFPSGELLNLLLWVLAALGVMMVAAGLVAALLRPRWVGLVAFTLSGVAMFLGMGLDGEVSIGNGILVLVYLLAAVFYVVGVARELEDRISFSIRPIKEGQAVLLMALVLVTCGSLYLSYRAHIEREGFSIPEPYLQLLMEQMEEQITARVPPEQREETIAQFQKEFRRAVDEFFESTVKPYERFISLGVAAGLFTPLVTITRLVGWVPNGLLVLLFLLLEGWGVIGRETRAVEVERLIL